MVFKLDSKWDVSFFDQLEERTYRLDNVEIEYGYYEDKKHKGSGLSMGSLALIQEYGSVKRNIPRRPFVFYSARLLNDRDVSIMRKAMVDFLFKRKTKEKAFAPVGRMAIRSVQRSIMSQRFTPLKKETVQKKGSSTILVEDHELINGVEWKIK